jgi:hypothetical protein
MEKGDKKKTPKVKKEKKEKKPKEKKPKKEKQPKQKNIKQTNKQTVIVGTQDQGSKQTIIKREDVRPTTAISHTQEIILDTLMNTPLKQNITQQPYISITSKPKISTAPSASKMAPPVIIASPPAEVISKPVTKKILNPAPINVGTLPKITDLTFDQIDKMTKTQIFKNIGDFNLQQLKHVASILGLSQEGRGKMDILNTISNYTKAKVKESEDDMRELELRLEEKKKMIAEEAKQNIKDIEDVEGEEPEIIVVKRGKGRPRKVFEKIPVLEEKLDQEEEIVENFKSNVEETKNELELIRSTIINQDANLDTKEIISSIQIPMFSGNEESLDKTFRSYDDNAVNNTEPVDEVLDYIMGMRSSSQTGAEEATGEWLRSKVYESPLETGSSGKIFDSSLLVPGMQSNIPSSEFEYLRPADPVIREKLVKESKKAKDLKSDDLDDLENTEIYDLRKDFNIAQLRHIAENKGIRTSGLSKKDLLNRLEQNLTQYNLGI